MDLANHDVPLCSSPCRHLKNGVNLSLLPSSPSNFNLSEKRENDGLHEGNFCRYTTSRPCVRAPIIKLGINISLDLCDDRLLPGFHNHLFYSVRWAPLAIKKFICGG